MRIAELDAAPAAQPAARPARRLLLPAVLLLLNAAALGLLALPLLVVLARALMSGAVLTEIRDPVVFKALTLSLTTTLATLVLTLLLGTPLAFALARYDFPFKRLVSAAVDLPMVLPPAVAGLALLLTFGRRGALGPPLQAIGVELAFTTAAVVLAQTFVAAPFYIRAARAGFEGVDPTLERVAATLGVSEWAIFRRVTAPLACPSLLGGAVMAWARALGEFGATI
ncbi:MAG: ABC transporter permease, partial [Chloroflexi bacterium]|nr:ABC transporter permease [Chloroflexota bacterium]